MNIDDLVRGNIKALKPYRSARHDFASGVLLDANENSLGSAIQHNGVQLNRYPDPFQKELRQQLSEIHSVRAENVFVGVGSDEVIDLLIRVFCEPARDSIIVLEPTYGMYRVAADINDVAVRSCLLADDFQVDLAPVKKTIDRTTKMIFCCSPNNPTGNLLRREDILNLCAQTPAVVVVDEAYADFSNSKPLGGAIATTPNLVILRTLSKAWGLAGIRLGYAIASPSVIAYLLKIKAPYNINVLTSAKASEALASRARMLQMAQIIIAERERLARALAQIPCVTRVFPSDANFLLIRCRSAETVRRRLIDRGIIVRDRSSEPMLEGCLRITVGTPEQNRLLIEALKELSV
jgi:histidinol-phosphate aminotransferase